jgi:hypothetical protein
MGFLSSAKTIERGFAWSFAGFVIGTISLALAVTIFYLSKREAQTEMRIVIRDEVNLVEVKEEIPRLSILYDGENILESKKEIKVLTFTVENRGQTILQNYYDQDEPFGILFEDSVILGATLVDANSKYIRDKLKRASSTPSSTNSVLENTLYLEKIIFEHGKHADFKVLLMQERGVKETTLTPLGKISGMDTIPVEKRKTVDNQDTSKSISSTLDRVFTYVMVGYFTLVFGFAILTIFLDLRSNRKRQKAIEGFLHKRPDLTPEEKEIVEDYQTGWRRSSLRIIRSIIKGKETIDLSEYTKEYLAPLSKNPVSRLMLAMLPTKISRVLSPSFDPRIFLRDGIEIQLNPQNRELVLSLLEYTGDVTMEKESNQNMEPTVKTPVE